MLSNTELPREKVLNNKEETLSDHELLAVVLRSGGKDSSVLNLAQQLLKDFGSLKSLAFADINLLKKYKYIGETKSTTIKALSEISKRIIFDTYKDPIRIKTPKDIYDVVRNDIYKKQKEIIIMLCLDTRRRLISKDIISIGTINEALIHPREIYRHALIKNAVSIALAHNHPSGDPTPSIEDIKATEKIAKAGIEIGISFLDHVIATDYEYCSIKSLNYFSKGEEVKT